MRRTLALALFALVLCSAGAVHAGEDDPSRSQAAALVDKGLRFARSGDFADAVEQFEAALKIYPSAEIMHSLARAHEELGHLSQAHSWFGKALRITPDYLYAEDARARIEKIEGELRKTHGLVHIRSTPSQARVSVTAGTYQERHLITPVSWWIPAGEVKLVAERSGFERRDTEITIQAGAVLTHELVLNPIREKGFLTVTASAVGAVVKVDGLVVGTTPLGTLTLAEGTHVVEVQAPGGPPMTRTVAIVANEAAPTIAFDLSQKPQQAPEDNRVLWAGLSFGGSVGLVALGAVFHRRYMDKAEEGNALYLEVESFNLAQKSNEAQDAHTRAEQAWAEANGHLRVAVGSYVVSAGLIGVGVYMLLKDDPPQSASTETRWLPLVSTGPDHVHLGARLQF